MASGERSVWILPATGAGDNQQLRCIAEALGWPYAIKPGPDPLGRVVRDRLFPGRHLRMPADRTAAYAPPWPDVVLFSGGRSVVDARRIRVASGGHTRLVCVGRPWANLEHFDLVVTTPQYRLPVRANVLENALSLQPSLAPPSETLVASWSARLARLPRPWLGALVGGVSGSYRFPAATGTRLGRELAAAVRRTGGSVLVSTSARTPTAAVDALEAELDVPAFCYRWQPNDTDNPLPAFLALADRFLVTGDSAAMIADACGTERPVVVFEPPQRLHTRLLTRSWLGATPGPLGRGLRRLRDRLVARGLWVPARDLGRYHRVLQERGWIESLDAPALPSERRQAPERSALEATVARIRSLI